MNDLTRPDLEATAEFVRAHAGDDEAATLRLFRDYGPWRFGTILWVQEGLLGARCPEWTVRKDRIAHPVVSLAARAPESLDEPIPVLVGTSSVSRDAFPVEGVTTDGRVTRFVPGALAWVTPRDLLWRAPGGKDRMEAWPWEVRRAWPNERLPRLSATLREELRSFLARSRSFRDALAWASAA